MQLKAKRIIKATRDYVNRDKHWHSQPCRTILDILGVAAGQEWRHAGRERGRPLRIRQAPHEHRRVAPAASHAVFSGRGGQREGRLVSVARQRQIRNGRVRVARPAVRDSISLERKKQTNARV